MKTIDCSSLDLQSYAKFLDAKLSIGYEIDGRTIHIDEKKHSVFDTSKHSTNEDFLFDYQKFIVNLAFNKKRFAIFADCGLGKTIMFLSFINRVRQVTDKKILIVCPLMVVDQIIQEEKKFYDTQTIKDIHDENLADWLNDGKKDTAITNLDKFHKQYSLFGKVGCVVLDESSILKNCDGVTRNSLIESCKGIEYKLCSSATPAPNDREEYANHACFLDYVRSNNEFFARFFVNKDNGWIIKPHGLDAFYKYLSEWSVFIRNPKEYGFASNILDLPAPIFENVPVEWTIEQKKYLKAINLVGEVSDAFEKKMFYLKLSKGILQEKNGVKVIDTNKTMELLRILRENPNKKTVIWVAFNEEERLIKNTLTGQGIEHYAISGATKEEERIKIIHDFENGKINVLISKPKLLGFGLNLPFATVQIFNALTDSYEQFYQSIKRSYRYGNKEALKVYITFTQAEKKILDNVLRKQVTWEHDSSKQEKYFINNLEGKVNQFFGRAFQEKEAINLKVKNIRQEKNWTLYLADSIPTLRTLPKESIDLAVFSPPFANLFTYSNDIADMGNSGDGNDEFNLHFEYFLAGLHDVMKKGRIVCCHLSQLSTFKGRDGFVGLKDFRGAVIELFQKAGFIYFGEWAIPKNPQMQAIKEKVRTLSFAQLESDRLGSRGGLCDFVFVFKKRGESDVKLNDKEVSRDEWIEWANGVWTGIKESDTLNVRGTKDEDDVKHICPLNLEVIRRCIRLYSTKDELVLDPFNGIGSTGVISLEQGRKYLGIELKPEYFEESIKHLKQMENMRVNNYLTLKKAMKLDVKNEKILSWM